MELALKEDPNNQEYNYMLIILWKEISQIPFKWCRGWNGQLNGDIIIFDKIKNDNIVFSRDNKSTVIAMNQ